MTETLTETKHKVKEKWSHLCFVIIECSCGKNLFSTNKKELAQKWKEHEEA